MPEKEKNGKLKKLCRVLSGKDYVLGNERVAKIANKKAKKIIDRKGGANANRDVLDKRADIAGEKNKYMLKSKLRSDVGEIKTRETSSGKAKNYSYPTIYESNSSGKIVESPKKARLQKIIKNPKELVKPQSTLKMKNAPLKKSKQRIEQDYARNAIADYESGNKKAAKYEKKRELEVAAGEGPKMMKSPMKLESAAQERKDLMMDMPVDERAAAKMMKSPNKMAGKSPMKMGGSWMSKHSALKMMKPSPAKLYKKKK